MGAAHGEVQATAGELYDADYYSHHCGEPYRRDDQWLRFFGSVAERLVTDIHPATTLDAGCALGMLVEQLRDRGVDAEGIDISEYAISQCREDIREHCRVGSVLDPFPRRYDLIICMEVVEHLDAEAGEAAIANLCQHTDDILFTSTPFDYDEITHLNVQPPDYWTEVFARHGFVRDVDYDASWVTSWAMRFRRSHEPLHRVAAAYERSNWKLRSEVFARRRQVDAMRVEHSTAVAERDRELARLRADNAEMRVGVDPLRAEVDRLSRDLAESERQLDDLLREHEENAEELAALRAASKSVTWRAVERVRRTTRRLAPVGTKRNQAVVGAVRGGALLIAGGPSAVARAVGPRLRGRVDPSLDELRHPERGASFTEHYHEFLRRHEPDARALTVMRGENERWPRRPLISLIVPVYNPEAEWLEATIDSVRDQNYGNWELCLADDCSTKSHVRDILERHAAADDRVRVVFRETNGRISAASNTALEMARGEYVALLDHDDLLRPHALHALVDYLNRYPETDVVYSDEDKLLTSGELGDPFFKPDWSPALLLSANYITHLTLIRRALVEEVGGFRSAFDGSQDYDLLLRCSERARLIGHVPEVLYAWRQVPGSAALSTMAKPYAYVAAQAALTEALQRRSIEGSVELTGAYGWYRVRHPADPAVSVAVVVPAWDDADRLRATIRSIERGTRHRKVEIVVAACDSRDPEMLDYLAGLRHTVIRREGHLHLFRVLNQTAHATEADVLVFTNGGIQVVDDDWIDTMLEQTLQPGVGAVGCRLIGDGGHAVHEGIVLGHGGQAATSIDLGRYFGLDGAIRDVSAVSAACMMIRRTVFEDLGGFDEGFRVGYGDVDLCLRARERGLSIIYTPLTELYDRGAAVRQLPSSVQDRMIFQRRWGNPELLADRFLSPTIESLVPLRLRLDQPLLRAARPPVPVAAQGHGA